MPQFNLRLVTFAAAGTLIGTAMTSACGGAGDGNQFAGNGAAAANGGNGGNAASAANGGSGAGINFDSGPGDGGIDPDAACDLQKFT
ncbi:MAG TPA: hypothetical protein PKD61_05110, partial [Polyangiaceae bacterium]|nr:hypothetical protein [Polyangiaceae bacterium]